MIEKWGIPVMGGKRLRTVYVYLPEEAFLETGKEILAALEKICSEKHLTFVSLM